jgi:hypothetical protein
MQHCAGFISADSLYMFRASGAHHQEYLKIGTAATGTCFMVAGGSSHHHTRPYKALHGDVMTRLIRPYMVM